MSSPLTSANFVRLLDKRLTLVEENKYKSLPSMIPALFNVMKSESAWEEFFSIGAVPNIPVWEGKVPYLSVAPGFHTKIEHKAYSGGVQIERTLIDDKKYSVLDSMGEGLMVAAHRTRENLGVKPFAYAFSAAFDFMTSEENVSLCSTAHTTKSGASTATGFSNSGSSAFSPSSVAATRILMRQFRNDIGERISISNNLALVVPDNLADLAHEYVGTESGLDSAEGNKNMIYQRYKVIPYSLLDDYDSNNWFMVDLDAMKKDLIWYDKDLPEIKHTVDFDTWNYKYAVWMRHSYGHKNWHWIYGHNVS